MIPRTIHYCWFGRGAMPPMAEECIASWRRLMPDWEYRLWNEDNFDVNSTPYTAEAYAAGRYAFVTDYVRLWALEQYGGVYLDVDFKVYRPFDTLIHLKAFAGFEGSKHIPVMMGVVGTESHGLWASEMIQIYNRLHFRNDNGTIDLTTNVQRLTAAMAANGLCQNGKEQDYKDLHIFPIEYFSPRLTTGEYFLTENTYCEHQGLGSWSDSKGGGWKNTVRGIVGQRNMTRLIKLKRKLIG